MFKCELGEIVNTNTMKEMLKSVYKTILCFTFLGIFWPAKYVNSKASIKPALACENRMLHIACPHSSLVVNVRHAVYGRKLSQSNVCPAEDLKDCGHNVVTPRVMEQCQWKTECSFTASNYYLGSYCTNVFKYLKVFYECVTKPTTVEPPTTTQPTTPSTTTTTSAPTTITPTMYNDSLSMLLSNYTLNSTLITDSIAITIPAEEYTPLTKSPSIDAYDREVFKRNRGTASYSVSGSLMTSLLTVLLWNLFVLQLT